MWSMRNCSQDSTTRRRERSRSRRYCALVAVAVAVAAWGLNVAALCGA